VTGAEQRVINGFQLLKRFAMLAKNAIQYLRDRGRAARNQWISASQAICYAGKKRYSISP